MKKILLIGSELGKGGAERSLSYLSYYLSEYFDVTLCILSGTDRQCYYPTCSDVRFIDPPASKDIRSKLRAWRYRLNAIRALKEEIRCVASISFLEGPNYVNVLTRGDEKIILSVRGSTQFDKEIKGAAGWLRKKILIPFLYPRADNIVCASQQLTNELNTCFQVPRHKLSYIYNLYDEESIRQLSAMPITDDEQMIFQKPVMINSGRLHKQKRQAELIFLFSSMPLENRGRLVLLGDGTLKEDLENIATANGLKLCDMSEGRLFEPADVYLLGYHANPFRFYAHSQLFVLSSGWEGFPNAMAEALICGLPVLAADCPTGPREILNVSLLSNSPTQKVHRLPVGSLMPMLDVVAPACVAQWTNELTFWMTQPRPKKQMFDPLTKRFCKEEVVDKWVHLIPESQKPTRVNRLLPPVQNLSKKPLVIQMITNLGVGGAQRVFYDHCCIFSGYYQVEEVVFDRGEQPDIYGSGNMLHSLEVQAGISFFSKLRNLFRRSNRLRRIVQERGAALVISHMDGANWINILSGNRCPKVLVVHGTVLRDGRIPRWQQALRRRLIFPILYNKAAATIAVSEGIKTELEFCGVRNVRTIPNFFDLEEVSLLATDALPAAHAALLSNYPVLVTAGRFSEQKKQVFLIKVFSRLKASRPNLKFVFLGAGELEQQLIRAACVEGLMVYSVSREVPFSVNADVFFLGYVKNPFSYLSRSRLFLFSSAWEGFPMALCEAMICGVPVLAADCPTGPRQILAPGTARPNYDLLAAEYSPSGVLLPMAHQPGAINVWSNAVAAALDDFDSCQARALSARHRMKAFDRKIVVQQWLNLINGLLCTKRTSGPA